MIRLNLGVYTPHLRQSHRQPFFPFGVFQFKAGDDQFSGIVEDPVTCTDGTTALWVAGSFQNRGETSTFSFTSCKQ